MQLYFSFETTFYTRRGFKYLPEMVPKNKKANLKDQKKQEVFHNAEQSATFSKKAKIIVRNLPFKNLSEESVKAFFKEYGDIVEVNLLRKDDGKFIGCGFIQFKKVSSAAKAIRHANLKEMSDRKIIVDWALPKKTFLEKVQKLEENHHVNNSLGALSENHKLDFEIDKKPSKWNSKKEESDEDNDSEASVTNNEESSEEDEDYEDDDKCSIKEDKSDKFKFSNNNQEKKPLSNCTDDVEDGRTIFVRNIPFSATNEDLKNCFESYGPIEYALICIDKLTEHSKGTGFVKFKNSESTSQCVKDSTEIYLQDNPLIVTIALSKNNLENKKNSKKMVKDSRNLYLIKEGIVIAGSKAAVGVSAADMAKRLQLEQWKNQILRNLNMFVSKTRLIIHNLPPSYDDVKLRNLFVKYSDPKAVIKEAKVMYDKKKLDSTGQSLSKEIGFVSFTKHEDALEALRNINNNPNVFTYKKRPIVAFSIENKAVINSKLKRVEKSRVKLGVNDKLPNKLSKLNRKQRRFLKRREKFIQLRKVAKKKEFLSNSETEGIPKEDRNTTHTKEGSNGKKRIRSEDTNKPNKKLKSKASAAVNEDVAQKEFTGMLSESGKKIKLRSKFRLKNQVNIHRQTLKAERRKKRERERKKLTVRKPMKEKKGKPKLMDDAHLSKLLKKHRESIQQSSIIKKWYEN